MPDLGGDIVMQGLNGPLGLFVDADGSLWVIDSGMGGSEAIQMNDPFTFEAADGTFGETSQVIKRSLDGTQEVVAMLPSPKYIRRPAPTAVTLMPVRMNAIAVLALARMVLSLAITFLLSARTVLSSASPVVAQTPGA